MTDAFLGYRSLTLPPPIFWSNRPKQIGSTKRLATSSAAYCCPGISVFSLGFLFTPGEGDVSAGAFPPWFCSGARLNGAVCHEPVFKGVNTKKASRHRKMTAITAAPHIRILPVPCCSCLRERTSLIEIPSRNCATGRVSSCAPSRAPVSKLSALRTSLLHQGSGFWCITADSELRQQGEAQKRKAA